MQYMKSMLVVGCLLIAASAHAQWGWDEKSSDDWIMPEYRTPREDPLEEQLRKMERESGWDSRSYYETKPWREYNEMRNSCDAITGNDAARADCFQGLGGW